MDTNSFKITYETVVVRNNDIHTVDLDGEIGMLSIKLGKYFCIDSIGTDIWRLLDSPKLVNDIVSALIQDYDVERSVCEEHVLEFLNRLYEYSLISTA